MFKQYTVSIGNLVGDMLADFGMYHKLAPVVS